METRASGYGLIEGPVWCAGKGLYFSDVLFGGVFLLDTRGDVESVFEHRRGIGGMALHSSGGLVVTGRNVSLKPFHRGETQLLLDRNLEQGNVGYNDLTTDSAGRIYVGSLGASPVFDDGRDPTSGDLYMIDLNGEAIKVGEDILLTNGLGFSPDGRTLYHSDTTRKQVNQYAVHDDGTLGEKQVFVETDRGLPDGLVVSEDGSVWIALAGGGQGVGVYSSDGLLKEYVDIPTPMCTSVCFGGDDLRDLYIVSGSDGTGQEKGGGIYVHRTEVPGLPVSMACTSVPRTPADTEPAA